jgi:hypothetical protein
MMIFFLVLTVEEKENESEKLNLLLIYILNLIEMRGRIG